MEFEFIVCISDVDNDMQKNSFISTLRRKKKDYT